MQYNITWNIWEEFENFDWLEPRWMVAFIYWSKTGFWRTLTAILRIRKWTLSDLEPVCREVKLCQQVRQICKLRTNLFWKFVPVREDQKNAFSDKVKFLSHILYNFVFYIFFFFFFFFFVSFRRITSRARLLISVSIRSQLGWFPRCIGTAG